MANGRYELKQARAMLLDRLRLATDTDEQIWLKQLVALIDEAFVKGF